MLGMGRVSNKKLHSLLLLCLSETAMLAKSHQDRRSQAEHDVAHLLRTGQFHRALLWVERVIREQTMIDVMFMLQQIIRMLKEEAVQIRTLRLCPYELREAVASLIYAVPRCGDCPSLHKLSRLLHSWFMKHSFTCASEANTQMVQMLSTREQSLERRTVTMAVIAEANGIKMDLRKSSLSEFD